MNPSLSFSKLSGMFCIGLAILAIGCQESSHWQAEADSLARRAADWNEQFDYINYRIDSLWDTTSLQLAKQLPADFPEVDRDIFIRARNADHIRMFMSYKQLDTDLQGLVTDAGRKDAQLAEELRRLHLDKNALEDSISGFLLRVIASDPASGRRFAAAFASLEKDSMPH